MTGALQGRSLVGGKMRQGPNSSGSATLPQRGPVLVNIAMATQSQTGAGLIGSTFGKAFCSPFPG